MPIKDPVKRREYMRAWREARTAAGQCWGCRQPAANGTNRCEECTEKARAQGIARRAKRKVQGMCIICGKPVMTSRATCQACIAREANSQQRYRSAVLDHYGRTCACCGEDEERFLCVDHINNDGAAHRAMVGTGVNRWVVKNGYPEGFQILCFNCNVGRQLNKGVCPHVKS